VVKRVLFTLVVIALTGLAVHGQDKRNVAGIIYFTNNTPPDVRTFSRRDFHSKQKESYRDDATRRSPPI
jgi:nicotinamide mononucleotide (NMN) deamidase PncC